MDPGIELTRECCGFEQKYKRQSAVSHLNFANISLLNILIAEYEVS
jgi:hypothetical protein